MCLHPNALRLFLSSSRYTRGTSTQKGQKSRRNLPVLGHGWRGQVDLRGYERGNNVTSTFLRPPKKRAAHHSELLSIDTMEASGLI